MISNTLEHVSAETQTALRKAAASQLLRVSAISVWEVGILARKKRLALQMHVATWVERALAAPGVEHVALDATIALLSTTLPNEPPPDPADRFLLAKAHSFGWTLVTSDARMIRYAGSEDIAVLDARR